MTKLIEMSEREYFASVGERPGMFVGRSSFLYRLDGIGGGHRPQG